MLRLTGLGLLGVAAARAGRAAGGALAASLPEVTEVDIDEAIAFLAGQHPGYPNAGLSSILDFSAASIVETMDSALLDEVHTRRGPRQLFMLYDLIGFQLLEALLDVYGARPVVLALDAGHGGKREVYYDSGANGTEAYHTRGVVAAIEGLATDRRYQNVTIRRIFNDEIGDDFDMPRGYDCDGSGQRLLRNVRASMLCLELERLAGAAGTPVPLHVLSVHFNDGADGVLALHQGETVRDAFRKRSVAYAAAFVERAHPALNASGLLPVPLTRVFDTGLSDDRMLYDPPICYRVNPYTGVNQFSLPARYALLQSSLMQMDFADGIVRAHAAVTKQGRGSDGGGRDSPSPRHDAP